MENNYSVYQHVTPDGLYYFGQTQKVEKRWECNGIRYKGTALQPYIEKYGWDNIQHIVLFENQTRENALWIEDFLIETAREDGVCINKQRSGLISKEEGYDKKYYEENKDKKLEYQQQYREQNKEQIREYQKQYREQNKDKINEQKRNYYERNKEKFKEYREQNKEQIREYQRQYQREYKEQNKDKIREYNREYQREYRQRKKLENQLKEAVETTLF